MIGAVCSLAGILGAYAIAVLSSKSQYFAG